MSRVLKTAVYLSQENSNMDYFYKHKKIREKHYASL